MTIQRQYVRVQQAAEGARGVVQEGRQVGGRQRRHAVLPRRAHLVPRGAGQAAGAQLYAQVIQVRATYYRRRERPESSCGRFVLEYGIWQESNSNYGFCMRLVTEDTCFNI